MILSFLVLSLILFGAVSDNYMISTTKGIRLNILKNREWIFFFIFLYIIECQVLLIGYFVGILLKQITGGLEEWMAILTMFSIGIKMVAESRMKKDQVIHFNKSTILSFIGFGASIYILTIGCCFSWLNIGIEKIISEFFLMILISLLISVLLGVFNLLRIVKVLTFISPYLVIIGTLFLLIQKMVLYF